MKKSNIIITVFSLLMLTDCTTDELAGGKDGQIPVQLCVSQDASASFTRTTSDLHTATTGFAVNETMKVFMKNGETTTNKIYKVSSNTGTNPVTATLAPNTASETLYYPTATSGTVQLYAVYPDGITQSGTHTVAYDQTGDVNYRASDLMYSSAKAVDLSSKTSTQALNSFAHKMVRLKLNIIKASDVSSVTEVKMVNVKRKVTVSSLSESGMTLSAAAQATGESGTGANTNELLVFSGTNSSTSTQTYYVVFPKQVASGNDWNGTNFISVTADGSTVNYTLTKEFTAGNQYELTLNINAAALGSTINITGWTNTTSQTIEPTKEVTNFDVAAHAPAAAVAVDLGLPSGTKWANMNVGAEAVTDYGTYFAWGETIGYTVSGITATAAANNQKTTAHSWDYYWWGSSQTTLTKYVPEAKATSNGLNGFYDNKTQLELANDAARVNWGGNWRMPTKAECQELLNNTTRSAWQTNYNGVSGCNGYVFTSKTDVTKSIFLPAAGSRFSTSVSGQGSYGVYWSSSLYEVNPRYAWYLYFSSSDADVYGNDRCDGYSVRAVCEE